MHPWLEELDQGVSDMLGRGEEGRSGIAGVVRLFGFVRSERRGRRAFTILSSIPSSSSISSAPLFFSLSFLKVRILRNMSLLSPLYSPLTIESYPQTPIFTCLSAPKLPLVYFSVTTGLRSPHHI